MFDLKGKVAVVTGASRGLGRAIAVALGRAGAAVVVNYTANEQAARQTLDDVVAAGASGELRRFDVADPKAVDQAFKEIAALRGKIDILVNNAGIAIDGLVLRQNDADWNKTLATNLTGAMHCTRAALRTMIRSRWGRIIGVSSVVGEMGNPGQAAYAASKAALIGFAKSVAKEYASRGVTSNVVAPGFIETDMTVGISEELKAQMVAVTPLGRIGKPEDVAPAVVFLASEEASYITGQVIRVNGGMYV